MCRTMITISKDNTDTKKQVKHLLMNELNQSLKTGNTHGFFVQSYGGSKAPIQMRTASVHSALAGIHMAAAQGSRAIHTHARKVSRGALSYENIHGWNHQGWSCAHNGTIYLHSDIEIEDNDSRNVFNWVFNDNIAAVETLAEKMQDLFENHMWVGTGTFTAMNADYTVVASINRDTVLRTYGDEIINIVSNPDVFKDPEEKIRINAKRRIADKSIGALTLKGKIVNEMYTYDTPSVDYDESDYISHNEILIVNNRTLEVESVIPVVPGGGSFVNMHEYV